MNEVSKGEDVEAELELALRDFESLTLADEIRNDSQRTNQPPLEASVADTECLKESDKPTLAYHQPIVGCGIYPFDAVEESSDTFLRDLSCVPLNDISIVNDDSFGQGILTGHCGNNYRNLEESQVMFSAPLISNELSLRRKFHVGEDAAVPLGSDIGTSWVKIETNSGVAECASHRISSNRGEVRDLIHSFKEQLMYHQIDGFRDLSCKSSPRMDSEFTSPENTEICFPSLSIVRGDQCDRWKRTARPDERRRFSSEKIRLTRDKIRPLYSFPQYPMTKLNLQQSLKKDSSHHPLNLQPSINAEESKLISEKVGSHYSSLKSTNTHNYGARFVAELCESTVLKPGQHAVLADIMDRHQVDM
eukprot:CAMPEP_0118682404 /NCGR_PEP_ID=MMETSP0800-20121206/5466_1 /TAXON_ID=210618 ORGANISM="Striatella unipunctata, Strain CCMP2910" /NCGR_SAMPLE_ID=MMETSP0800 /ASSEMBLY_ACC=CAM_ASM_000638 /LENGTH=361 /DNA_ID=CAMNT_0006578789 /DNA_START=322 /DNA_END=1407 /DNA_ORIENTATION=-